MIRSRTKCLAAVVVVSAGVAVLSGNAEAKKKKPPPTETIQQASPTDTSEHYDVRKSGETIEQHGGSNPSPAPSPKST